MPRYLIVTDAWYLGAHHLFKAREDNLMILVEEDDGTLRNANGEDLLEIDRRFPGRLGKMNRRENATNDE